MDHETEHSYRPFTDWAARNTLSGQRRASDPADSMAQGDREGRTGQRQGVEQDVRVRFPSLYLEELLALAYPEVLWFAVRNTGTGYEP